MGLGLVFLSRGHPRSGRPFLAASPFSEKNFAPGWPRNGDHEVGRPRPSPQSSPLSHIQSAFTLPMYFRSRYCISTERKLIRFSRNPPRNPGRAPPTMALLLSALSMGHFWARCMLGFDLKPRSHHHGDRAWVVRGCQLSGGLLDQHSFRSFPNKAVDVVACQTFSRWIAFRVINSWLSGPRRSNRRRLSSRFPSTQLPFVPSPPMRRSRAAHRPRHSPKVDVARPPASALPLPRPSSSRSFPHARTAPAPNVVSRCRVQTVPRYTVRSPPTACAASCPRLG